MAKNYKSISDSQLIYCIEMSFIRRQGFLFAYEDPITYRFFCLDHHFYMDEGYDCYNLAAPINYYRLTIEEFKEEFKHFKELYGKDYRYAETISEVENILKVETKIDIQRKEEEKIEREKELERRKEREKQILLQRIENGIEELHKNLLRSKELNLPLSEDISFESTPESLKLDIKMKKIGVKNKDFK